MGPGGQNPTQQLQAPAPTHQVGCNTFCHVFARKLFRAIILQLSTTSTLRADDSVQVGKHYWQTFMCQPFCPEVILTYLQIARRASHSPWRSSWTPWSSAFWFGKYSPQLWFKTITSLRLNVSLRSDQYPNVSFNLSISWCRISCSNVQSLSFLRSIKANICIRDLIDQTLYIFYAEKHRTPFWKGQDDEE